MYEEFKQQLTDDRKAIIKRIEQEATYTDDKMNDPGELSHYDNHPADEGTELYFRGRDMAVRQQWEKHLHEIDEALKRIENGTYGICKKTGEKIPLERLRVQPTATTTVKAREKDERATDRPVEEEVLFELPEGDYNNYMDEDTSPDDDTTGYTEEFESFLSTGLNGYEGSDKVTFHRNKQYKRYTEEQE
ncbi:TraR/DksA C4-type zinc finger protein [Salipaludibacillus aurantiacus]|uniref:RNA polymerase-binding protein DksA n=1 Tax=Salipaludibacillus aurantiacus TaxID=1601833 RepID=A0A1H9QRN9_9BACI|nr:TraR/DksA C4-type zinc finger protein [Salipaludibacillus aurantiacus]SER63261.1 RNA polymerase-binding protein DksA [Salipaludibacillus aurantiacus]